jgi:acetyl esterase/lipase
LLAIIWLPLRLPAQPPPNRERDIVYHRLDGAAFTMDVFRPQKPSGVGVLWMVSGGWVSNHQAIDTGLPQAFLERGQTLFAIVHGSQPRYKIPEIVATIDRATRFVRTNAARFGVDPERLGIMGASAGGHLSIMQGATGSDGRPDAADPVERAHSRVQAVACFFPPTDFLNYGSPGRNALTVEMLRPFWAAFGANSNEPEELERAARIASPLPRITAAMPPTLIIHGDKDVLVPIQQAELVIKRLEELKVPHELVVRKGHGHGWPNLADDLDIIAGWIDRHAVRK